MLNNNIMSIDFYLRSNKEAIDDMMLQNKQNATNAREED